MVNERVVATCCDNKRSASARFMCERAAPALATAAAPAALLVRTLTSCLVDMRGSLLALLTGTVGATIRSCAGRLSESMYKFK